MMKGKKKVDPYADERKDPYAGDVTGGPGGRIMQEDIPPPAPPAPPVRKPATPPAPVVKKAMGGKIGRGCGVAMRGGGCVMRKGGRC